MRMGIGLGVGINRSNYAQGIFNAYSARVVADGGVVEGGSCVDAVSSLLQSASLLLIPSGYKGGKLYAEIPTNGNGDLTWTRGSDAFRTNASGVIQRVPWNLLQYSEQFNDVWWSKDKVTISANAITSPNGTATADLFVETTQNGAHSANNYLLSLTSGSYTFSVYAKAKERSKILVFTNGSTSKGYGFDLANGTMSAVGGVTSSDSYSITNVGDGWYRCTITNSSTTITGIGVYLLQNFSGYTYTGDGTSGLFFWGAQLVEGTTAQTYLPTTDRLNFPRLSYMYGSCPAVLAEPQRTNIALWSQDFDNASWTKVASSITANTTTSPDGSSNADKITASANNSNHGIFNVAPGYTVASLVPYAYSCYAKKGNVDYLIIDHFQGSNALTWFNINDGTIGTTASGVTASIQSVGNGWYRCTCVKTITNTSNIYIGLYLSNANSTIQFNATGNEFIYLFGAQIEAGSYQTTYIPTTSATATRVADSFSRNNIYTNGLISASGGTWFVELRNNISYTRDAFTNTPLIIGDNATSPNNGLMLRNSGGSSMRLEIRKLIAGTTTLLYTTLTDTIKIAFKWNGSSVDVFVNGTKQVSASFFATTNMDFLVASGVDVPKFIQQMALFPTPLSDTDCTTLTT